MEQFTVTLVEGQQVHHQLGVSDARFKEINESIDKLFKDEKEIVKVMVEAGKIGQTPGEVTLALFQAGRKYEQRNLENERAKEEAMEELAKLFGGLGNMGRSRRPRSVGEMLAEALGGGRGRAGGISLEDLLGEDDDECPIHGKNCPNKGEAGAGIAGMHITPDGVELVGDMPPKVREVMQEVADVISRRRKEKAASENSAQPAEPAAQ